MRRLDAALCVCVSLAPLAKPNGDVRPIAVPVCLRRLLGRAVARQYKDVFKDALSPQQCAVGLAGGTEIMQKTALTFAATHSQHAFFKLDCKNGYNSQWRAASVGQGSEDVPDLAGLFSLCYCRGETGSYYVYRAPDGTCHWVRSDGGVDQGDGLAPALFAFGMKKPASALLAHLQELSDAGGYGPVLVLVYLDDVVVAVPPELAASVVPAAAAAFGPGLDGVRGAGLELEPTKTQLWVPSGVRPPDAPDDVRWMPDGLVIVGAVVDSLSDERVVLDAGLRVGAGGALTAHWAEVAGKSQALLDRVLKLFRRRSEIGAAQGEAVLNSAQRAQLLLRFCVEPSLLHILRATPPGRLSAEVFVQDGLVHAALSELAGVPLHAGMLAQAALPLKHGGCGVGGLAFRHHAAYIGSWALVASEVLCRLPPADARAFREALTDRTLWHPVVASIAEAEGELLAIGVPSGRLPQWSDCAERRVPKQQSVLSQAVAKIQFAAVVGQLAPPEAARLRSCGGVGAGAFLVSPASEAAETELLDGVFSFALRWRLGSLVRAEGARCQIGRQGRGGVCGAIVDCMLDHVALCKYGGFKTIRHSLLVQVLRAILRESGAAVANKEVEVSGWRRADGTKARLGVSFLADGIRSYVDVTIRHPRAAKYVAHAAAADGAAAQIAEVGKRERCPAVAGAGLQAVEPFCVESFGRLGPAALRLLRAAGQRAAEHGPFGAGWASAALQARWLARLSCALHKGLYEAMQAMCGCAGPLVAEPTDGGAFLLALLPLAAERDRQRRR